MGAEWPVFGACFDEHMGSAVVSYAGDEAGSIPLATRD